MKMQTLIQYVWGRGQDAALLTSSHVRPKLWSMVYTLSNKELKFPPNARIFQVVNWSGKEEIGERVAGGGLFRVKVNCFFASCSNFCSLSWESEFKVWDSCLLSTVSGT